jgi:trans-aconitate 2-methyltransferase
MSHRPPYVHLTPEEYRRLASDNGLCVERLTWELKTWDFGSRRGFVDWAKVTFDEWTNGIPENQRLAFIDDVLDSYGRIDGRKGGDVAIFKFYQLEAVLRVV